MEWAVVISVSRILVIPYNFSSCCRQEHQRSRRTLSPLCRTQAWRNMALLRHEEGQIEKSQGIGIQTVHLPRLSVATAVESAGSLRDLLLCGNRWYHY
jgi:hypothetical protein